MLKIVTNRGLRDRLTRLERSFERLQKHVYATQSGAGRSVEHGDGFRSDLDIVHTALFGWPVDHLTPLDKLLAAGNVHQAALELLRSDRFRWDIRSKLPIWPHDKWVCAEYKGHRIWVNLHDSFVSFGVLHDDWEVREVDFMVKTLHAGDSMLDIGANIGVYTVAAAQKVGPSGRIYAFEPNPEVAKYLTRTVEDNRYGDRVVVHQCGLADRDASGRFYRAEEKTNLGASFVKADDGQGTGDSIQLRKLDSIDLQGRVTFLKMDVEGFEVNVLDGGTRVITEHKPVALAELYPQALKGVGGTTSVDYMKRWDRFGYDVFEFEHGLKGRLITTDNVGEYDNIVDPINILCLPRT